MENNILAPPIFPMFNSFDYNSGFLKSLDVKKFQENSFKRN